MFETCVNRNSSVSALRDGGFRIEPHIAGAACRTRMRRKRLSRRPNFRAGTLVAHATPLKRLHRHDFPRQTTRAEAAKGRDCHRFAATCPVFAARLRWFARLLDMCLKRFNPCWFWFRSDFAILILPQQERLDLVKKAPLSKRLFVLDFVRLAITP
jgi:hypothetical protein